MGGSFGSRPFSLGSTCKIAAYAMKGTIRVIRILSVAALLVAVPAAGLAEQSGTPNLDKKICRNESVTGSIMSRRVCHTKAEWEALEAKGKADLERTREMERSRSLVNGNR